MDSDELYSGFGWRITMDSAPLPDGRVRATARVHRCDSAHIIAIPSVGSVLMLREYRPFYGDDIWMLPSGKVDKEANSMEAAQRELREETGFRSDDLQHFYSVNNSESIEMTHHIFVAKKLVKDPLPADSDEVIEVHEVSLDVALQNALSSKKIHVISAFALLAYMRERS